MYCARDTRPTSLFVIASVTERSLFDALHTNTAGKSDISIIIGNNKCACKVRKKSTLLLCSTVHLSQQDSAKMAHL